MMNLPEKVSVCEVGLRDGLQNEKVIPTTDDKLELLKACIDAGYRVIEVGSFMHPKKVPQMADTDELVKRIGNVEGVELRALIPNVRGVQRAIDCGCKKVKLNVSASRMHNLKNLNRTPEESVAGFADCVELAKKNNIAISGSISMPFASPWEGRTPVEDVDAIIEAYLKVGIDEISLSDASGQAVPNQVYDLCRHVREKYTQATWWLHFHNTRGAAMANILAAMQAGMTQFDTSFGGLGGCPFVPGAAGNISSEDVINMLDEMGIATGVDVLKVMAISRKVSELLGHGMDSYVLRAGRSKDLIASQSE
ncbi:MAG: hydroxymethylglutaryl-CoA lyase [Synergistaceae bacterium]|nr:hydroxymethylglutaryl-CoA lyase [Synergistaceae bacterium]MBQ3450535.1 hydroxymethylglutaryl-CoA lyase [Synergistaceae bacterium]MBQ3693286.1 hydroxymethylglutaryl-CoA lyase [Synergistaceae bacterium]MBQ9628187.1 hydroxymethylglutaryl-CoA lyase [Synergistaceae bacterium]